MKIKLDHRIILHFIFAALLYVNLNGCSSSQHVAVSTNNAYLNANHSIAFQNPIIGYKASQNWLDARNSLSEFSQSSSIYQDQAVQDSFTVKTAKIKLLYNQAIKQIEANHSEGNSQFARDYLDEASGLLSELLSHPDFEPDSSFSLLAFYVLQTYDRHIQRLNDMDTDNPILAVYEHLFGISNTKEINENLFLGFGLPESEIPLVLNADVKRFITLYSVQLHDLFQRYLNRAEMYFPMMTPIIDEENIPKEIINLSIVESGVNPKAKSRASAVGIWQFIKSTGRIYGLYNNHWFDERQHIQKSTRSAVRHLKDLYKRYGDWYLALAAYNAGAGKVNRAIRKANSRSFWKIKPYLRRETRQYVPRFIAATIIAKYPERFGFAPINYKPLMATQKVQTNGCIPLSYIAEKTNTPLETLKILNPELSQEVTPPAFPNYNLIVPEENAEQINELLAEMPEDEKLHFKIHKVRQSYDYISSIAEKYGLDVSILRKINGIRSNVIPRGKVVMIPTSPEVESLKSYSIKQLADDSRLRRRWQRRRYAQKRVAPGILVRAYKEAQSKILTEVN